MEIINFLIGQLVGLVEPFLAIDFIIKCLGWKEGVRHRKQLYMGHLIVEEQVKRLGGMVEYYEDEMFCAHIYLPM